MTVRSEIIEYSEEVIQRANFNHKLELVIDKVRGDRDYYLKQAQAEVDNQNSYLKDHLDSFRPDHN